jgi:hypothetical protein
MLQLACRSFSHTIYSLEIDGEENSAMMEKMKGKLNLIFNNFFVLLSTQKFHPKKSSQIIGI